MHRLRHRRDECSSQHYNIPATLAAGSAAYCVGDKNDKRDVLIYGKADDAGNLSPDPNAFHVWVQAGDDVIDFQAPLFPALYREGTGIDPKSVPAMFQKTRVDVRHISEFKKAGEFCYAPYDPDTTLALLRESLTNPQYTDAWRMMMDWYVRPPKKIRPSFQFMSTKTGLETIRLSNAPVDGTW